MPRSARRATSVEGATSQPAGRMRAGRMRAGRRSEGGIERRSEGGIERRSGGGIERVMESKMGARSGGRMSGPSWLAQGPPRVPKAPPKACRRSGRPPIGLGPGLGLGLGLRLGLGLGLGLGLAVYSPHCVHTAWLQSTVTPTHNPSAHGPTTQAAMNLFDSGTRGADPTPGLVTY